MPVKIPVPDASWGEVTVPLGGETYDITYRYVERDPEDPHWRMDIYQGTTTVMVGIKLVADSPLIGIYALDDFRHGEILCQKMLSTNDTPGRGNVGIGKEYELVYYSLEELIAALA